MKTAYRNSAIYLTFLVIFVFSTSCQRISTEVPPYLSKKVENIKKNFAPDSRVELFDVQLKKRGDQLFVYGEVADKKLKQILLDSLRSSSQYYDLIDSVRVLPAGELHDKKYGIVYISVANMRKWPRNSAELVNQVVLGTVLPLYKRESGFYFAQNVDRYLGWVSGSSMVEVDSSTAFKWLNSPHVICSANFGVVLRKPDLNSEVLTDLVPLAKLKELSQTGNWIHVETPDGRKGFVQKNLVFSEDEFIKIKPQRIKILETAKKYLGVPYLWGGTSTKGFDCSGFVQTAFKMNNFQLPRDTNQMVLEGNEIKPTDDLSNLLPGDLLFFGPNGDRITHVAVYLGDQKFIHSDGWVHINSFNPSDSLYNEYRHSTFREVRRILPN